MWKAGVVMEQKPMHGVEPLDPPSPEIAQLYLQEAQQVEHRRDEHVDPRAAAWRSVLGTLELAIVFTAFTLVMRVGDVPFPLLLLVFVLGQINAGFAERQGVRWRVRGWGWGVLAIFMLAFLAVFVVLQIAPLEHPLWMFLIPGALLAVGGVATAVVQFWNARGSARVGRRPQEPTPKAARLATAALGVVLGICAVSVGLEDELIASIIASVLMLAVVAWLCLWATDFGPQALGRYWNGAQEAAFHLSVAIIVALSLLRAYTDVVTPMLAVAGGTVAALALIGSAFVARVPGRAR